jgi:hypothetical protein
MIKIRKQGCILVVDCPQTSENGKPLTLALSGVEFTPYGRYSAGAMTNQAMIGRSSQTLKEISQIGGFHDSAI